MGTKPKPNLRLDKYQKCWRAETRTLDLESELKSEKCCIIQRTITVTKTTTLEPKQQPKPNPKPRTHN